MTLNMIHKVHPSLEHLLTPISDLVPDPNNVMEHSDRSVAAIADSLSLYGQDIPVIAQKSDRVVKIGNGRLAAAKSLGWTHVAAVFRDDDSLSMTGRAVADNRTAQLSTWNPVTLADAIDTMEQNRHQRIGWLESELESVFNPNATGDPGDLLDGSTPEPPANDPWAIYTGMPEFENEDLNSWHSIRLGFRNQAELDAFGKLIGQTVSDGTRGIWYPPQKRLQLTGVRYFETDEPEQAEAAE